jgi:hypothetical protein
VRECLRELKTTPNDADVISVRDRTFQQCGTFHKEYVLDAGKQMLLNGEWSNVRDALAKAIRIANEWSAEGIAARNLILKDGFDAGLDLANEDDLAATIVKLGQNGQLLMSETGRLQQAANARRASELLERAKLIAAITAGKSMFDVPRTTQKRLWKCDYGRTKPVASSTLDGESLEDLRLIAAEVAAYRQARDGETAAPEAQQDDSIEASVPAPKVPVEARVMATDEFLAQPGDPSREYTRKELMGLNRAAYNHLLFSNGQSRGQARHNAITRILQGKKFGA